MNAKDVAKLKMSRTVQEVCENNKEVVATNKAFGTALLELKTKTEEIFSAAEAQGKVITGVTVDKNVDKEEVAQAATDMAGIVFSYASAVKNNTLKAEVDFSYSDIARLPGDLLVTRANSIYNNAKDYLAVLGDAGVTEALLAVYKAKIDKYSASLPAPRAATSAKGAHTSNLEQLMREMMAILTDQMDKLIVSFKAKNLDFVALYSNARTVVDTGANGKKTDAPAK